MAIHRENLRRVRRRVAKNVAVIAPRDEPVASPRVDRTRLVTRSDGGYISLTAARLRQYLGDRFPVVDIESFASGDFQLPGIETELM